jgi:hypothetical protein
VATETGGVPRPDGRGRDLFLTAWRGDAIAGSISMDVTGGGADGAHLRWFVVSGAARGSGLGKELMAARSFADSVAAGPVWLTTFAGLDAARALYEKHGFALDRKARTDQWQGGVREQMFSARRRPAIGGKLRQETGPVALTATSDSDFPWWLMAARRHRAVPGRGDRGKRSLQPDLFHRLQGRLASPSSSLWSASRLARRSGC